MTEEKKDGETTMRIVAEVDPLVGIPNEEKLALHDMPEADAVAIFLAWLRGEKVDCLDVDDDVWKTETSSLYKYDVCRIPPVEPTKDTVPWHVFGEEMQRAAVDCEGEAMITAYEPQWEEVSGYWYCTGPACLLNHIVGYKRGTCAPKDSLQRRPEGV